MGAHGSKEKLQRSTSERYVTQTQIIERERFGSFGKRSKTSSISNYSKKKNIHNYFIIQIFFIEIHN